MCLNSSMTKKKINKKSSSYLTQPGLHMCSALLYTAFSITSSQDTTHQAHKSARRSCNALECASSVTLHPVPPKVWDQLLAHSLWRLTAMSQKWLGSTDESASVERTLWTFWSASNAYRQGKDDQSLFTVYVLHVSSNSCVVRVTWHNDTIFHQVVPLLMQFWMLSISE